jgi:hypothetical protein
LLGGKGLSAATKVSQYERSFSSGDFVERGKAMAGAQKAVSSLTREECEGQRRATGTLGAFN